MAKKAFLAIILAAAVAGGAFAGTFDEYAPGIDQGIVFINAGVGYGLFNL